MTELAAEDAGTGKRERTKQANRAAILEAGLEVFSELGYGAATVRDVTRRTELAAGTFYNYFPDKESIFRAIVEESATETRARVRAARTGARDVEAFVRSGYRAYLEFLVEDRRASALMRRNAGTIRLMFDEPVLGAGTEELEADLRAAVAAGLLPEHDAHLMAAAMVGAGFEVAQRMLESDPPDVEHAVAFLTDLFLAVLQRLGA